MKQIMSLILMLLLVMVCIIPMVGIATADDDEIDDVDDDHDDDGDDVDDDHEESEKRELDIEVTDYTVKVESDIESKEMENEYKIDFSTHKGIALDLEYSSEVNSTDYELELAVLFQSLVEYIDENGDGVYSEEEAVQTIDLMQLQYSNPSVTQITSIDGEEGYKIESHSEDQTFDFQIIAYTFPKHAVIDDSTLNPTEMKITIVINNFTFRENQSELALLVKATSVMEMETETRNQEDDIEIKSATATGYFSWSNEVFVDGAQRAVNSTVIKTGEKSLIALSYPQGTEIVHDPRLGVSILAAIVGFPWPYFIAGAAVIAIVVVMAIRVSRPRIQNSMHY